MKSRASTPRTLSIGGATYDLFVKVDHKIVTLHDRKEAFTLPLGKKVRVENVVETCGGGASNTSVGLSRLGMDAAFSGVIGNDQWGDKMLQNFEKEGVSTGCLTIVEDEVSSFSIILSASSGERVILYEAGTNEHLHDVTFNKCTASEMDWIYLNHIQETTKVIEDDLIEMLSAPNAPGLTWNPGGSQIIAGCSAGNTPAILSHTDILLLNKTEALEFSKQSSLKSAFETLFAHGPKIICITQGKEGVVASDGTEVLHCPTATDKSVDTTGAGDAFGTGATWAISQGQTLKESLKAGTLNAASVVNAVGSQAGLLTDTKMEENMKSMHLEVSVITL